MGKSFEIPPNVLSSGTYACMFTVELVVIFQVVKQAVPEFSPRRGWQAGSRGQVMADLAKDPGPTLCGATDHDRIGARILYYLARLFGTIDIPIGDYRNFQGLLDFADRVVFRFALIQVPP